MTNIQSWLDSHQSDDTQNLDLWLLLSHVLKRNRAWLYSHTEHTLSEPDLAALQTMHEQLASGVPLAYITGTKPFWSLNLKVTKDTLIPRPETELLVELALQHQPQSVLDMGTGTGAIALALASEWPHVEIHACDLSAAALAVAKDNAETHQLNQVTWHESDWFASLSGLTFDLIISNPPYIHPEDNHLKALKHEPLSALVAEESGLADIKLIARGAVSHLNPGGLLMVEHGWDQKSAVQQIFADHGFQNIQTHQDLGGRDRVTVGKVQ